VIASASTTPAPRVLWRVINALEALAQLPKLCPVVFWGRNYGDLEPTFLEFVRQVPGFYIHRSRATDAVEILSARNHASLALFYPLKETDS
jgi:hypothetical protein